MGWGHVLILPIALAASVSAQAQTRAEANVARQSLAEFAKCLSVNQAGRIGEIIALPADSTKYRRAALRLYETADAMCAGDATLKYNPVLFAGAMYEALYVRDFGYGGPAAFPESVTTRYVERYRAPYSADARQAIALEQFGECVARAEPGAARQLVLSVPGTPAEETQLAALKPRFGACVINGKTVEMSKGVIRGAVAEGLYRLSIAAAGRTS